MANKLRFLALIMVVCIMSCALTGCLDTVMEYLNPGYSKPATGLDPEEEAFMDALEDGLGDLDDLDDALTQNIATPNNKPGKQDTATVPTQAPTTPTTATRPTENQNDVPTVLFGYITGEPLNIRTGPGKSYEATGLFYYLNDTVYIYEVRNGWGRTDRGWISMDYFSEDPARTETDTVIRRGYITGEPLHIRNGPGKNYESLGFLYKGDYVEIYEISGNWGRIDRGWISLDYVS